MRMATITGVLAMCGVVLAFAPESQAKPGSDWSRVQGVEAARQVRIVLHDDESPKGRRKLKGVFASATADSLTIVLRDGTTRAFQRGDVRRVSVKRPFLQRRKAWGVTALAAFAGPALDLLFGDFSSLDGWLTSERFWLSVGAVAIPVWVVATFELSHKPIYAMPRT